jgi:hypothetical protein
MIKVQASPQALKLLKSHFNMSLAYEGVSYLPIQGAFQSSVSVNDLEGHGIRFVRVQWVDLVNNIRCRVVPLAYFKKLVGLSRPGLSMPKVTLGIVFLSVPEGFRHVFETNPNMSMLIIIVCLRAIQYDWTIPLRF